MLKRAVRPKSIVRSREQSPQKIDVPDFSRKYKSPDGQSRPNFGGLKLLVYYNST